VKVVKNKCAPPFRQAEFDIQYSEGISHTGLLVDLGAELGVIDKSGSWFSYGDLRLGQGKENSKQFFIENPDIAAEVEARIRATLGLGVGLGGGGNDGSEDGDDAAQDD
jgi:recombination protein RecA